jgi:hypothetical protein
MQQSINLDPIITNEIKHRSTFHKIYTNQTSHFVLGTFKAQVFNIKSYLSSNNTKDEYLYLSVNLLSLMANTTADYLIGDGIQIDINNEQAKAKRDEIAHNNNFDELIYNIALNVWIYGYAVLRTRKDDNEEIVIEEIPYDYYYPQIEGLFLGEQPKIIYLISHINETLNSTIQSKAKIQTYTKQDNGSRLIEYGLYTVTLDGSAYTLEQELATPETLDFLNIYRFDNKRIWGKHLWISDYGDVLDLLEEVNDRFTQISVQFIKHLNSKISLPEWVSALLQNKEKKIQNLEVFVHRQWEQPAQYIENHNSLIPEAQNYVDKILKLIWAITQIPLSFFWFEEAGGAEKVEALRIRLTRFLKKIQRKQRMMELILRKLVKETLTFAGIAWDYTVDIKFSDAMLKDLQQNTQMYIDLYNTSLVSQETAIGQIFSRDATMVQQEVDRIKQEQDEKQQKQIELNNSQQNIKPPLPSKSSNGNHWSKQK